MSVKKQNFGHIIKQARIKHNFTQERLAEALDISSRYMMSIEGGQRSPSLSLFFRLSAYLKLMQIKSSIPKEIFLTKRKYDPVFLSSFHAAISIN